MSLSGIARRALGIGMANAAVGREVADAIDRRRFGDSGTPHVAGDYALSGGFGATASVALVGVCTDARGKINVTSAGTGQGANPTVTLTFKDGAWPAAPTSVVCRGSAGAGQRTVPVAVTATTTTMTIMFLGTPVAAEVYSIHFQNVG